VIFAIDAKDLRRELYAHFQVGDALLNDEPIYLITCRTCGRLMTLPLEREGLVDGAPVVVIFDHLRSHPK
jgi:hypothetical protein